MIDTIALSLNVDQFRILDHSRFTPSTENLFYPPYLKLGARGNIQCVQNPTQKDKNAGIYKPRLTVSKRMQQGGFSIDLRSEFSVPKLLWNNNFDEVKETDFEQILEVLRNKLLEMAIETDIETLRTSRVSAIHYGKNILLTNGQIPYSITKEVYNAGMSHKYDVEKETFRNEGHGVKFHTNIFELAIYDKTKDLEQSKISEKRSFENDSYCQLGLFDKLNPKEKPQVLRIEARIGNRTKLKSLLKSLGIEPNPNFNELFSKEISQKVLQHYWGDILTNHALLEYKPKNAKDFLINFMANNKKAGLRKTLQNFGLITAINDLGIREFREVVAKYDRINWYRIKKEALGYKYPTTYYKSLDGVTNALETFEPLKLIDFLG